MMQCKNVSILSVEFNVLLSMEELPSLKRVIEDNFGLSGIIKHFKESDWEDYAGPVFQFKNVDGKSCMYCYGKVPLYLKRIFLDTDWSVWIGERKELLRVSQVQLFSSEIGVKDCYYQYSMKDWAFRIKNNIYLSRSNSMEKEVDKFLFTDVFNGLKSLGIEAGDRVETIVVNISQGKRVVKDSNLLFYHEVDFVSDVVFPDFFSIGVGSDIGFGEVSLLAEHKGFNAGRGEMIKRE